uniref:Cyclic nucleotide-binding domain-containing protein n=1 Tax=Alexandrium catenella TaxID=2925 RepID=A0A7S1PUW2_ALECA
MLRLAGFMRLARFVRLVRYLKYLKECMDEKMAGFVASSQCLLLIIGALWLNHLIGCGWFAVGRLADSDTGRRWTDVHVDGLSFLQEGVTYQYVTSLHWSLAQFTLGAVEISCTNSVERVFTVVCLFVGLIFGSTLVSSLSAGMVDHQMRMMEKKTKIRRLQRYLRESKVCQSTSLMIQEQAEERLKIHERLKEEDVPVLQMLSGTLRTELRHEIVRPHLCSLPLYNLLLHMDLSTFQTICMQAVGFVYPHRQDDLFVAGTQTDKAYLLMSGSLLYNQDPHESRVVVEDKMTIIDAGTWLSEAALWCHWTHVGTCKARSTSHVLSLDAEECLRATSRNPIVKSIFNEYCRTYHQRLIIARPPDEPWCNDLQVPNTDWDKLVLAMDQAVRARVSLSVVEQLEASFTWIGKGHTLEALRGDIAGGGSCLTTDACRQPERLVSAVRARMANGEGHLLMKVAKAEDERSQPRACCKHPQVKLSGGETCEAGLLRLLGLLGLREEDVRELRTEARVEHKQSTKFGVRSRCMATEVHLEVMRDLNLAPVVEASVQMHRGSIRSRSRFRGTRRPVDVRGSVPSRPSDLELCSFLVYKVRLGTRSLFFAWLPSVHVEYFATPAGKKDLTAWVCSLKQLSLDTCATEKHDLGGRAADAGSAGEVSIALDQPNC